MLDIHGWVEVTRFSGADQEDEHAWTAAIRLSGLVDVPDAVSERLFGLSSRYIAGEATAPAVAANRGLPPNPSDQVKFDRARILDHEQKFGSGEFGGYTFAGWREIKAVTFTDEEWRESDWKLVFSLIREIESDWRFSEDKIRIVAWYAW
jgi:hypothetical protein